MNLIIKNHGYETPKQALELIPQQSCGVLYPPTSSGLFDLQISVRKLLKFESHE